MREQLSEVLPIAFPFSISLWERVREWTFIAHWLSAISPRKIFGSSAHIGTTARSESKANVFISKSPPLSISFDRDQRCRPPYTQPRTFPVQWAPSVAYPAYRA